MPGRDIRQTRPDGVGGLGWRFAPAVSPQEIIFVASLCERRHKLQPRSFASGVFYFLRSAVCPKPQRVARQTNVEIIPAVSRSSNRCELGQLALLAPPQALVLEPTTLALAGLSGASPPCFFRRRKVT
jgi:hypothetical protein